MKKYMRLILVLLLVLCIGGCNRKEDNGMVKTVKVKGIEMDYISFGNGKEVFVIMPGLSIKSVMGSSEAIAESYKDYTEKYTVYLFDGRKNAPEGYTIKDMADDTVKVMKKLNISKADYFGASQGGMTCQYIALDYPDMVNKMIIGSSCCRRNETSTSVIGGWVKLAEEGRKDELVADMITSIYSQSTLDAYYTYLLDANSDISETELKHFITMAKGCDSFDIYDRLSEIKCQVLVIGCENDAVLTAQASREIAEKIGCECYIYQDYGHGVYDEAPDYKERMLAFLNK